MMYASYTDVQLQSGKTAETIQRTKDLMPQIADIPGLKRFMVLDKGDDKALFLAFYDTAEDQVAATPKAQEVIGALADLAAAPPERIQVEVAIDHTY
jgi:heme-degrading monooxygenase HmoA